MFILYNTKNNHKTDYSKRIKLAIMLCISKTKFKLMGIMWTII